MANGIKIKAKFNLQRLKRRLDRWKRTVGEQQRRDVKRYANEGARLLVRCTPPSSMGTSVAKGIKALKGRIQEDLMGENTAAFTEADVRWARDRQGNLFCYFDGTRGRNAKSGRPGPFRTYKGRINAAALAAMNVNRYGIRHVTDVGGWIRSNPNYYKFKRRGSATRLSWTNAYRHVAAENAVKKEVRRRQKKAGQLMAGWQPLAKLSGLKLQAAVARQRGRGNARMQNSVLHKAVITAQNKSGYYPELQRIVDRQMPYLQKKLKQLARRYAKQTAKKLK